MSWEVPTMQSKTSFFNRTVFLHDLKRWWPLTAGYALIWLLAMPLGWLTELNHDAYLSAWNVQFDALDIAGNAGYWSAFLTGILFAMAAFSYLTNPRATYGLHALPERRETLYVTHYLAGLCSQLAPQLLTVLRCQGRRRDHAAGGGDAFPAFQSAAADHTELHRRRLRRRRFFQQKLSVVQKDLLAAGALLQHGPQLGRKRYRVQADRFPIR